MNLERYKSSLVISIHFLKSFFVVVKIYLFHLFTFGCAGSSCCAWAFSSCGEQGLLFVAVCGLLIAVASLVAEHRL